MIHDSYNNFGFDSRIITKWNPAKAKAAVCQTFRNAYPSAECLGVSPRNYAGHLLQN